jgi:hypothetical protein
MYLAGLFALTMGAISLVALALAPTRRRAALWLGTLLAPLTALLVLAPTLWPYLYLRLNQGYSREMGLDTPFSFFLPGPGTVSGRVLGLEGPAQFGPGLVVVVLMLVGVVVGWMRAHREGGWQRFIWSAQTTGLIVSLGMILSPIWVWLALPGLDMVRGTNRAFFITLFFAASFVAEGVAWMARRVGGGKAAVALTAGVLALVAVDMGSPPDERVRLPVGDELPPAFGWLAKLPPKQAVYESVVGIEPVARAMYHSIYHQKPLATGYSGFMSPAAAYMYHRLRTFPSDDGLALLDALGVRYVLWHFPDPPAVERFLARLPRRSVEVAARFGTDVIFKTRQPYEPPSLTSIVAPLPRTGWRLDASQSQESLPALIDGDLSTVWRVLAGRKARTPWITVDLGGAWPIAGVRCTPVWADAPGVYFALVEVSSDGIRWERIGSRFRPDSLEALLEQPALVQYYEARFPTREARYVRLTNPEVAFWGWPWEIAELEILSDCLVMPTANCPRNARSGDTG